MESFEPAHLRLHRSGRLEERMGAAEKLLANCRACPRACGVNRLEDETGYCRTGRHAVVSSAFPHHGEEAVLTGRHGSGTIFFSLCNLRCVFCQNADISQRRSGRACTPAEIARMMLDLQGLGCHNLNLVTPEHVAPQIILALGKAIDHGFRLPIVYNTSGYDAPETLALLDGLIDIYMPDFKVWRPETAALLCDAEDYPDRARVAIAEMHRQVAELQVDETGLARRGLLIRHLVMPGLLHETESILNWIGEELSRGSYVNLLAQYYPANLVGADPRFASIARRTTQNEMRRAYAAARAAGLIRFADGY